MYPKGTVCFRLFLRKSPMGNISLCYYKILQSGYNKLDTIPFLYRLFTPLLCMAEWYGEGAVPPNDSHCSKRW